MNLIHAGQTSKHALVELGRFFETALEFQQTTGKTALMPSCLVDRAWHDMMNEPPEYEAFSMRTCGMEVEHQETKGEGEIEWVELYYSKFGPLSTAWFISPSGDFDRRRHEEYLKTGVLKAAWDCGPAFKKVDPEKTH